MPYTLVSPSLFLSLLVPCLLLVVGSRASPKRRAGNSRCVLYTNAREILRAQARARARARAREIIALSPLPIGRTPVADMRKLSRGIFPRVSVTRRGTPLPCEERGACRVHADNSAIERPRDGKTRVPSAPPRPRLAATGKIVATDGFSSRFGTARTGR